MNTVFVRHIVLIGSLFAAVPAYASEAKNIQACVAKAKEYAGISLNEFDARYEGNWMSFSKVYWENAECEVKLGYVRNLKIDGKYVIYKEFAGEEAYRLNERLEQQTKNAIQTLESRIKLLEERMEQTTEKLKAPHPDLKALEGYVNEGIEKAL